MLFPDRQHTCQAEATLAMVGMAMADGELAMAEYEFLLTWAHREGIAEQQLLNAIMQFPLGKPTFQKALPEECLQYIFDMVQLMCVDYVVHPNELDYLQETTRQLIGVEATPLLDRMIACVQNGLDWLEAQQMLAS